MILQTYRFLMDHAEPVLNWLLEKRESAGKEHKTRMEERKGLTTVQRPEGLLYWVHAASVGEAQSALILINTLLSENLNLHIVVTTGTLTSADTMEKALPDRSFHQFYPLDRPEWAERFLTHWRPDHIFWMESELWPSMLLAIKDRNIPCVLLNARMSDRSFSRWRLIKSTANMLLSAFNLICCQTHLDQKRYQTLGAKNTLVTDNLKYSAAPLPFDKDDFDALRALTNKRPLWVYASTHAGEESLAVETHKMLKKKLPALLTVIVPRHPERREEINALFEHNDLNYVFRSEDKRLPDQNTDIYIADTLGELGLFYSIAPIACIGRSFSADGGGGHNPIEAAQLNCAVLHGPNVQNLQDIFDQMNAKNAALCIKTKSLLAHTLEELFSDADHLRDLQEKAIAFAKEKTGVLERIMTVLRPALKNNKDAV